MAEENELKFFNVFCRCFLHRNAFALIGVPLLFYCKFIRPAFSCYNRQKKKCNILESVVNQSAFERCLASEGAFAAPYSR